MASSKLRDLQGEELLDALERAGNGEELEPIARDWGVTRTKLCMQLARYGWPHPQEMRKAARVLQRSYSVPTSRPASRRAPVVPPASRPPEPEPPSGPPEQDSETTPAPETTFPEAETEPAQNLENEPAAEDLDMATTTKQPALTLGVTDLEQLVKWLQRVEQFEAATPVRLTGGTQLDVSGVTVHVTRAPDAGLQVHIGGTAA